MDAPQTTSQYLLLILIISLGTMAVVGLVALIGCGFGKLWNKYLPDCEE